MQNRGYASKGGWQYVTIPFSFVKDKYIGSSLYKTFYEICHIDLDGAVGNFDIADIRITPGKVPVFTLTNGNEDDSTLTMEYVETINYTLSDGTSGGGEITKDYFMTDSDITSTYMELIKARASGNSQAPYTLICNAGTKRVANVIDTQIIGNGVNVSLGYAAVQDEYYKGKTFYVPNYKTASEPSSGDNRTYTTTAYNIVSGKVKVIRQHTHVIKYPDTAADFMQVISDEYTWQDLFGATLQKRDAYGVTTENIFDEYNNLTQTKVSHSDTSEVILEKYVYSSDGEVLLSTKDIILNENNEEETFNEINYETDPLYGTLNSSQQAATSELTANTNNYTYNDFRDKLKQVELKVSGVPYGKNTLKYDENGRLCEASPSENCVYGFKYDKFGKAVEFSLNGVILLTKDYDYDKNSVSASYYRSETEIDILKTKYDKYGRIKKLYRGKPTERAKSRRRKR